MKIRLNLEHHTIGIPILAGIILFLFIGKLAAQTTPDTRSTEKLMDPPPMLILSDTITDSKYQANDTITATGLLQKGQTTDFYAGTCIVFSSGFVAQEGSTLQTHLEQVANSTSPTSPKPIADKSNETITSSNDISENIKTWFVSYDTDNVKSILINISLPEQKSTTIGLYDNNGRIVANIANNLLIDKVVLKFDGGQLQSGIYFLKIRLGEEYKTEKVIF